jgi:hypothetical protein
VSTTSEPPGGRSELSAAPGPIVESSFRRTRTVLARTEAAVANPVLAYAAILVLQLRIIWNVWQFKDLTAGDTSSYFLDAAGWAHGLHDNILWSPLYTNFFGTVVALIGDVPAAVMVHRLAIVLTATVLVLALMRSLLGPAVGLLAAVWWVVLPPNFNVEYEVHLFGLLPILVAALVVARVPGRRGRGIALATFAGTTLLLRNELVIATAILAVAIMVSELRERRKHRVASSAYLGAYLVPLVIVCLLAGGAYARSHVKGHDVQLGLRAKQDLNVCQIYAFTYQQRHPHRFRGSPWTDCAPLMQETFGHRMPSFTQAMMANPRAMMGFVAWNARLLASGLQVSLFGATATGDNPDYFPVKTHRSYSWLLTIVVLALMAAGLAVIVRDRTFWQRASFTSHAWAGLVLAGVAVTTLVVALTQRPRPEYMYGLTIGLIVLVGTCASAVLRRLGTRFVAALAAGLTLILCLALPSYYHRGPRPLHDAVERLQIVRGLLNKPGGVLVAPAYNFEICAYLAATFERHCTSPSWATLKRQLDHGEPVRNVLNTAKATAIYADPELQADPAIAKLLASPRSFGWRQAAAGTGTDGPWSILIPLGQGGFGPGLSTSHGSTKPPSALSRLPGDLANAGLVYGGIFRDGWVGRDAHVLLAGGAAGGLVLRALVPSRERGQRQHLLVLVNGRRVASEDVSPGLLNLQVAVAASRSTRRIELHWAGTARIGPNDPRQAAALLKYLGVTTHRAQSVLGRVGNSGFEADVTGWTRVDSAVASLTSAREPAVKKSGSYALKLIDTRAGQDDYYSALVPGLSPRTTYVVSAWANVPVFTGPAILNRGLYAIARGSRTYKGATERTSEITAATSGWVRKSIVVTTGASDSVIEIRLYAPRGTSYWDSVRVEHRLAAAH